MAAQTVHFIAWVSEDSFKITNYPALCELLAGRDILSSSRQISPRSLQEDLRKHGFRQKGSDVWYHTEQLFVRSDRETALAIRRRGKRSADGEISRWKRVHIPQPQPADYLMCAPLFDAVSGENAASAAVAVPDNMEWLVSVEHCTPELHTLLVTPPQPLSAPLTAPFPLPAQYICADNIETVEEATVDGVMPPQGQEAIAPLFDVARLSDSELFAVYRSVASELERRGSMSASSPCDMQGAHIYGL